ncbi:hypothetical protein QQM39_30190 [Streptomyces sp. DT2A-34]|uniref:hypothetical protein n=1 Tax=Streptomyces sp. DT2A-34 TaxID=3051182 RepID=UPI00265BD283|nr:hypothetical protein [Streptomyces sp. DT2A-34]MDO0914941.1 hypothetical protein [Streptomyces sp. DT2A-34]
MFFRDKHCRTCGGSRTQVFRPLTRDELEAIKADRGDLWRCTAEGCRWYQPWYNRSGGGLLPEELKIQPAATEPV